MSDLRVRSSAKMLKMGGKSFQVEPLTLPALGLPSEPDSSNGVWDDEARIRKAESAWISRRPVIPFEDWEVDPDDRILVLAIDSAWSVGMLGADPDRIHPTDHVQVFQAASKSKPKGFGLDQVLKFCGISRYAWWEISGQLSDGMRLYDLVLLLGAHKDYDMPFYLSSAPRRALTSLEERNRWFRWMRRVLWRRQSTLHELLHR